jgi:hypothetical protein
MMAAYRGLPSDARSHLTTKTAIKLETMEPHTIAIIAGTKANRS